MEAQSRRSLTFVRQDIKSCTFDPRRIAAFRCSEFPTAAIPQAPAKMSSTSIPRFLLPQTGLLWRPRPASVSKAAQSLRKASSSPPNAKSKPKVLAQPTKFNPPSHGQRLRKEGPRYNGPPLTPAQRAAQAKKAYPNMMPPEGTFMHWFINNRSIHIWITLGTLVSLAITAFVTNFKHNSPFADMLPPFAEFLTSPSASFGTCIEIFKLHTAKVSAETAERRKRKAEDVQKRSEYRKAHGLDQETGIGGWTAKTDSESLGPAIPIGDGGEPRLEKKPLKKWLGIW